jgi:hypothetical protein
MRKKPDLHAPRKQPMISRCNTANSASAGENIDPQAHGIDYLSRYKNVQSGRKRVKKKNVGITGTIVFIEGAHPADEPCALFPEWEPHGA